MISRRTSFIIQLGVFCADVRADESDGAHMSVADVFGLAISVVVFGYLVYALMRGERL
jgi:K+-transporting ATPase KdpF subunit